MLHKSYITHMMSHRLQEAYDSYTQVYKTGVSGKKRGVALQDGRYSCNSVRIPLMTSLLL